MAQGQGGHRTPQNPGGHPAPGRRPATVISREKAFSLPLHCFPWDAEPASSTLHCHREEQNLQHAKAPLVTSICSAVHTSSEGAWLPSGWAMGPITLAVCSDVHIASIQQELAPGAPSYYLLRMMREMLAALCTAAEPSLGVCCWQDASGTHPGRVLHGTKAGEVALTRRA